MIACLSPADNNYDETLSTLRYANRAKNIQNKPRINEDPKDTMLREYQEEIKKLRQMLETNNLTGSTGMSMYIRHERASFNATHRNIIYFPRYVRSYEWSTFKLYVMLVCVVKYSEY